MQSEKSSKLFTRIFLIFIISGCALIMGLCIYVNPWGNYGSKGFAFLYNVRYAKTVYLSELPKQELPDIFILGSSNVMRFSPETIKDRWNMSAFNYGVFWGKAEDELLIAKHILLDLKHKPKLFIIGVDTWTFKPHENEHPVFPGLRRRLINTPDLIKHHPDIAGYQIFWSKVRDLFSIQQLELVYRAFNNPKPKQRKEVAELGENDPQFFQLDGTRIAYGDVYGNSQKDIFNDVENGTYHITQYFEEIVKDPDDEKHFINYSSYHFENFWDKRIGYFEQLIQLAGEHSIKVVLVMNPIHPLFLDYLGKKSKYHLKNQSELKTLLQRIKRTNDHVLRIVDASQLKNFGGDPDGFYDEIHPSTKNCDLILNMVFDRLEIQ